jgi:hypothetical protein
MHVDLEGRHLGGQKKPHHFVVSLKTGPVHRSVLANFRGVFGFNEGISGVIVCLVTFALLLVLNVDAVSVILNEHAHNFLVTLAGRPEERVPPVFLRGGNSTLNEEFLNHGKVVVFDSLHETIVAVL